MENNEDQVGITISQQLKFISAKLNDWALLNGGIATVSETGNEHLLPGFTNAVGPKVLIYFSGENSYGDESVSDVTGRVMRSYDCIIQRGKNMTNPRNTSLANVVGAARPFYILLEEARDILRSLIFPSPMVHSPIIYKGMKIHEVKDNLIDSYIISFDIIMEIGRTSVSPWQLGGGESNGDFISLSDSLPQPNSNW